MYKRVPPVFSLQYLRVFLNAIEREGYNLEAIRNAIFNERVKFEKEKFKAIGRGFRLKTLKSEHLVKNCYRLSMQIGLLRRRDNGVLLSDESRAFLTNDFTHPETRSMLLGRLLRTYIPFNEVLFCVRNQTKGQFLLPMGKETDLFKSLAKTYKLRVDKIQFHVVRDLLTQLGILNWRETQEGGIRMQSVYLIAIILRFSEVSRLVKGNSRQIHAIDSQINRFVKEVAEKRSGSLKGMSATDILRKAQGKGYITINLPETEGFLFVRNFDVNAADFEEVLWNEYLRMSDYTSNYPVYYSELRDNVCEDLRISDSTFDTFIMRMINRPYEYTIKLYPGGGPMPPRRGLSSMLKALPPKTGSDEYITFLKASK